MPKYKVLKPCLLNGRHCPGKGEIVEVPTKRVPCAHLELVEEPKPAPAKKAAAKAAPKAAAKAATKPDADSFD